MNKTIKQTLKVIEKGSAEKDAFSIQANSSPREKCFRLVHDGRIILALFESDVTTLTMKELYCGTAGECSEEIKRLGLKSAEKDENIDKHI